MVRMEEVEEVVEYSTYPLENVHVFCMSTGVSVLGLVVRGTWLYGVQERLQLQYFQPTGSCP
jgi:hypothetical protein